MASPPLQRRSRAVMMRVRTKKIRKRTRLVRLSQVGRKAKSPEMNKRSTRMMMMRVTRKR